MKKRIVLSKLNYVWTKKEMGFCIYIVIIMIVFSIGLLGLTVGPVSSDGQLINIMVMNLAFAYGIFGYIGIFRIPRMNGGIMSRIDGVLLADYYTLYKQFPISNKEIRNSNFKLYMIVCTGLSIFLGSMVMLCDKSDYESRGLMGIIVIVYSLVFVYNYYVRFIRKDKLNEKLYNFFLCIGIAILVAWMVLIFSFTEEVNEVCAIFAPLCGLYGVAVSVGTLISLIVIHLVNNKVQDTRIRRRCL